MVEGTHLSCYDCHNDPGLIRFRKRQKHVGISLRSPWRVCEFLLNLLGRFGSQYGAGYYDGVIFHRYACNGFRIVPQQEQLNCGSESSRDF
jgi:hypothetical protein